MQTQKTAVITGATSGLGEAAALSLAREGYRVLVVGRDAERGAEVVKKARAAGGEAEFLAADLFSLADVGRLGREITARAPRLDRRRHRAGRGRRLLLRRHAARAAEAGRRRGLRARSPRRAHPRARAAARGLSCRTPRERAARIAIDWSGSASEISQRTLDPAAIARMNSAPPSSRRPSTMVRVLSLETSHVIVARGHAVVAIWRRPMDVASARIAHAALREVAKLHPGEAIYVNVIRGAVPPPSDDVRRELVAMVRTGAGVFRGAAVIALGNAFVGSLVRSVVAGMVMIARPAFPMKVFGDVTEATDWIGGLGGLGGGAAAAREVEIVIEQAAARLDAKAAADRAPRSR